MVPVGVGMIIASAGYFARGLSDKLAIATVVACVLTAVIEVATRYRR